MSKVIKRKKYKFGFVARAIIRRILPQKYNINYSYDNNIENITSPYFIFGNHTSFLDPFIMGIGSKDHVNFVANDEYFRFRIIGYLMKILGAIPKAKFMSDYETVKRIIYHKNQNDVIGIYPEGGRTWPGETQPILYSTSKLVNKLQIPVVGVLTKGGSLSFPRWGIKFRKGRVDVHFSLCLSADDISKMNVEEIHNHLQNFFYHNESDWNRINQVPFVGKRLAERLEWFIYACPNCKQLETMHSNNNTYTCSCGYSVIYNEYGFFEKNSQFELYDDDVIKWNNRQFNIMKERVAKLRENQVLLKQHNVSLFNGKRRERKLFKLSQGTLSLTKQGFILETGLDRRIFHYDQISGLIVNHKNILDFYYDDFKFRLEFKNKQICGYVWEDAIKALKIINQN